MKNENKLKNKEQRRYDKGKVFVKIMAGMLTFAMLFSVVATIIFYLV